MFCYASHRNVHLQKIRRLMLSVPGNRFINILNKNDNIVNCSSWT